MWFELQLAHCQLFIENVEKWIKDTKEHAKAILSYEEEVTPADSISFVSAKHKSNKSMCGSVCEVIRSYAEFSTHA